ncbi:MAG TPA: hypothetical protein DF383_09485, partial [Deltaproteobacteria bacterium]|nr:hypothetical protein [Deltaproteobacteria bacterium]
KKNLAYWAEQAAKGKTVEITKYNRPYVLLTAIPERGVRVGNRYGKFELKSPLQEASKGRFLDYLLQDRDEDR